MAKRESQGLQIALILFVMITAVLSVTTYLYWSKSNEQIEAIREARKNEKIADDASNKLLDEMAEVRRWIGFEEGAKIDEMRAIYESDMLQFAAAVAPESRNYRALPPHYLAAIDARNVLVADAADREKTLIADLANVRIEEKKLTTAALAGQQAHRVDLEKERVVFAQQVKRVSGEKGQLAGELDKKRKELTDVVNAREKEIQSLQASLNTLENINRGKDKKIQEIENENFENPDGAITWVNQGSNIVWINLGQADGLRRQTTFSVYDVDQNNLARAVKKGSIEVTRILDKHMAEARIVEQESSEPLLPKDVIYSPVWQPGKPVRFALAGFMDMNGDGKSDRAKLHNLITLNGGVIDAEVGDDGKRTGKVTIHTRYIVLGERPTDKTGDEGLRGYTNLVGEAAQLGVEQISVDKLLSYMGWVGEERTVSMGGGARGEDVRAKPAGGVPKKSTGNTSGLFRDRAAPKSAF